jgi:serine/threonine-protein kinase
MPPNDASAAYADVLAGTPYRALKRLGMGGMGEVFEAEHVALAKRVVVKLLRAELSKDPKLATRLKVEGQVLARLSSPYLVAVSDCGSTPAGRAFLVMERLYGRTLDLELRRRGQLPIHEAVGVALNILAGLEVVHAAGFVHRDIKASNVFLCNAAEGQKRVAKVLDFGIVKVLAAAAGGLPTMAPTGEGLVVGTPRAVSPEQARGQRVDARSDIYSVGVLLYTMVVGHDPFVHLTDMYELLQAHLEQTPSAPSSAARQPIPRELDRVILRMLEKKPDNRYASARETADALARFAAPPAPPAAVPAKNGDEDVTLAFAPVASPAAGPAAPRTAPAPSPAEVADVNEGMAPTTIYRPPTRSRPESPARAIELYTAAGSSPSPSPRRRRSRFVRVMLLSALCFWALVGLSWVLLVFLKR